MYSVYQHWDPLRVCVVGRSYPPEFYSWIKVSHVRELFERIAIETEEDYQFLIQTLESFGVKVLRPRVDLYLINESFSQAGKFIPPPMNPRDYMVMVGDRFYENFSFDFEPCYQSVKDPSWTLVQTREDIKLLPQYIQDELRNLHKLDWAQRYEYTEIFDHIKKQGNQIVSHPMNDDKSNIINGAMISRIGRDLYFGTKPEYDQYSAELQQRLDRIFVNTRNHIVDTRGHSDGVYCPVAPGLIVSLRDVPTYADTFPGWEVVYLPGQSWFAVQPFLDLKTKNKGKWWIPGFEYDQAVIDTVETWLDHWVGFVEETVFDVNMLIVDPKNVLVFNYNKQVFDALDRYGVTPHVVPFRHRYFWDGGIHCVTLDLDRDGGMQDFFPGRVGG
jgi:hypothetical protein